MFLKRCLTLGMLSYGSKTGHFDWGCANVLSGIHDAYSIDGAKDFRIAAKNEGIDVCPVSYTTAKSDDLDDMNQTIKRLTTSDCGCSVCRCRVNVAFGQPGALISLFKAAHLQKYKWQWLVGDSEFGSFDDVVQNLTNHRGEDGDDSLHKIPQGILKAQ